MEAITPQIGLTLTIIIVAVVLFATEKLRVDITAMLVLLALALTGLISSQEAFAGFASPAVITVWAIYIISGALFKTGVADNLGKQIIRLAGPSEPRLIAVIMLICGILSAFMNNIGATAVLLPAVAGVSRQTKVPLSRLLIPLSFASLMGGNMTLIGTPPNILATNILAEHGFTPFGFFDFTPIGLIVFGVGVLYMIFIGRHLLPRHKSIENWRTTYQKNQYVSEVRVTSNSPLAGQSLAEAHLETNYHLTVTAILHDGHPETAIHRRTRIQPNDLLRVEGAAENLIRAQKELKLMLESPPPLNPQDFDEDKACIVAATLAPRSRLDGKSLKEVRFRDQYRFMALAIRRHDEVITERLRDVKLQFGDTLLLKGPTYWLPDLQERGDFLILEPVKLELRRQYKAPLALGIVALVLLLVTLANFHISLAMVVGAVLMVLSGCLTMDEAYQSIEWRSVFLIAGMLPLGTAMETTGTAQLLADLIVHLVGGLGPLAVLAGVYILVVLITQPMSNAAATVLIVPIAIEIALDLGANPHPFVLATVIGASTSFITPVGHQANVLVFGPGGYRFFDYTRVGGLLNLVIFIATLIFLPLLWPLF